MDVGYAVMELSSEYSWVLVSGANYEVCRDVYGDPVNCGALKIPFERGLYVQER